MRTKMFSMNNTVATRGSDERTAVDRAITQGGPRRLVQRTLFIFGLVLGIGAWTSPTNAATTGWAYLWANQPGPASYTPDLRYQYNSTGAANTVTTVGVGQYRVFLPNLGANAGTVH